MKECKIKKFTFPKKHEPKTKSKSFEWIISEDKVITKAEIKKLKGYCIKLKKQGLKNGEYSLVRNWFVIELCLQSGLRVKEMTELKIKEILINNHLHGHVVPPHITKGTARYLLFLTGDTKHSSLFMESYYPSDKICWYFTAICYILMPTN